MKGLKGKDLDTLDQTPREHSYSNRCKMSHLIICIRFIYRNIIYIAEIYK